MPLQVDFKFYLWLKLNNHRDSGDGNPVRNTIGRIVCALTGLRRKVADEGLSATIAYIMTRTALRIHKQPSIPSRVDDHAAYERCLDRPHQKPHISNLVSIVLPIFNQAGFAKDAIEGVLAQTYEHWELIIINDGSTDSFNEAIMPYLGHHKIRVFQQPNLKLPAALNNGFREARGEYYTWTSADNVMLPTQLQTLVETLQADPSAGFAFSDYAAIDDAGEFLTDPNWRRHNRPDGSPRLHLPDNVTVRNFHESGDNFVGASFLWHASVHDVVAVHDENTFGGEDYDFWLRMHLVTPFKHIPQMLYHYRVHENTLNAKAKELNIFENVQKILISDKERREALLKDRKILPHTTVDHWRPVNQYLSSIQNKVSLYNLSALRTVPASISASRINVLFIDIPPHQVTESVLADFDIIVASSALTYTWVKRLHLPLSKRILFAQSAHAPMVMHACALRSYEKQKESKGYILSSKPRAQPYRSSTPDHILMLCSAWRDGGLEQVICDLAEGCREAGIKVTLGCADELPSKQMLKSAATLGLEAVGFKGSAHGLVDYVKAKGIDVVGYHHTSLGAQLLQDEGIPTVYSVHNSYVWKPAAELNALAEALRPVSAFICVSKHVAEYANRWLQIHPSKLFIVSNGTDIPASRTSVRKTPGTRFLCVGSLGRAKCQSHLVKAFAKVALIFRDTSLTIVGYPMEETVQTELIHLRERFGLNHALEIIPGMDRDAVLDLMAEYDCIVLPSLVEGWSVAATEALLIGTPLIATDVGSAFELAEISEAVQIVPGIARDLNDITGTAFNRLLNEDHPDFQDRLALAMIKMIMQRDEMIQAAMKATERAHHLFSRERMSQRYIDVVSRV